MFVSGLVVLSFPFKSVSRLSAYLKTASRCVERVLYVTFERHSVISQCLAVRGNNCFSNNDVSKGDLLKLIPDVYRIASSAIPSIDLRVLVNHKLQLALKPEILFTDFEKSEKEFWLKYANARFNADLKEVEFFEKVEGCGNDVNSVPSAPNAEIYDNICLGGTFDDLHSGHKVLLNEALLRCKNRLVVGVTDTNMIKKKILWELISPVERRILDLRHYLEDVDSSLNYEIVPISDPFGPAIVDETLNCLVVSEETIPGGNKINEIRKSKNMESLNLFVVNLVKECNKQSSVEEDKISSSSLRIRKLGSLWRKPEPRHHLADRPYLVGITGGIASGKTHICEKMKSLGAGIINCDILAHETYRDVNGATYKKIVEFFGESIVQADSTIDRRKLGAIVFSDSSKLKQLNDIVWPATAELVEQRIQELKKVHQVIVLEAAVLLEAQWQDKVHEVWVSIIPETEAIARLQSRNSLSEEDAKKRICSQLSNEDRVKRANVVFCSLWDYQFTESQVEKAWDLLNIRLSKVAKS